MAFFPNSSSGAGKGKEVDFNFPQDVSKQAVTDLDKALKSGDGKTVVDALVRYSLAQSAISSDNMPAIVSRIESAAKREKAPEYRALLRLLEARVFDGYRDSYQVWDRRRMRLDLEEELDGEGAESSQPKKSDSGEDYSEWSPEQFRSRIDSLLRLAIAEPAALKAVPLRSLDGIVRSNSPVGYDLMPSLLTFVCSQACSLVDDDSLEAEIKRLWQEATAGDPASNIYFHVAHDLSMSNSDIYKNNRDNMWCALALRTLYGRDHYADLKDYVARFPNSPFTPELRNTIIGIEERNLSLSYPEDLTSVDNLVVSMSMENVNRGMARLYQVPDSTLERLKSDEWGRLHMEWLPLVAEREATVEGNIPFNGQATVDFGRLPYGCYVVIPAYKVGDKEMTLVQESQSMILRVHDLNSFSVSTERQGGIIIAVNDKTGAPVPGASIESHNSRVNYKAVTNADGSATVPKLSSSFSYSLTKGDDRYLPQQSFYINTEDYHNIYNVRLYTDLGIYRPGETVRVAGVAYSGDGLSNSVDAGHKFRLELSDAAGNDVDSLTVVADDFGRFTAEFVLPTDRMNGEWTIIARDVTDKRILRGYVGRKDFEVSEYKTPTFDIEWTDAKLSYVNHQSVKLKGRAVSYSGMPLQNADVQVLLKRYQWSWWWRYSSRDIGTTLRTDTVRTDAQGNFELEYPAETFPDNASGRSCWWSLYSYDAQATVTNEAGETHEASHHFIIGTRRGIEFTNNDIVHNNIVAVKLPLKYNTTSETQTWVPCTWEVTRKGESIAVLTGNLNTNDPTVDLTSLPSGQYRIKVHILDAGNDEDDANAYADVTLYRLTDKQAPVENTPLWAPKSERSVDSKNVGHILVGTSVPEAHVYLVVSDRQNMLENRWLHLKPGMHQITVNIPRQKEEYVNVRLVSVYEGRVYSESFTMESDANADGLKVEVQSFRNKLVPGEKEHWTFTVKGRHGDNRRAAIMLEMFDKALNTLADNTWSLATPRFSFNPVDVRTHSSTGSNSTNRRWSAARYDEMTVGEPYFHLYDQDFFETMGLVYETRAMGAAAPRGVMRMQRKGLIEEDNMMAAPMASAPAEEYVDMSADDEVSDEAMAELDNVTMRMADVKTALWRPMLTTNEQGEAQVEFDAPEFNTTWLVQALAWDANVYADHMNFEVMTQKPIMVKANPPRFVRHGDRITFAASVQNATDAASDYDAVIELFDPRSETVYDRRAVHGSLGEMGSEALTIDWQVPGNVSFVGIRVKAVANGFGDGEQVMVPVLENTQPVIESTPFFLDAGTHHSSIDLPQFPRDARVTLEYCDNPIWYCVTALPTLFDGDYVSASSLAHNLFALRVAQGVAILKPEIKQAIDYWKANDEDSTLVSMLAQNRDLKIGTLLASPWLPEADRQTLRMSRLNELFDTDKMAVEQQRIVDRLLALQNADGGLSWIDYPERKSSLWATGLVLEIVGQLRQMKCLNDDERLNGLVERAIVYFDRETLNQVNRQIKLLGKKNIDYADWADYVYTRQMHSEQALPKDNAKLVKDVLKAMDKQWSKGLTHGEKAFYALTLDRGGYHKTASRIVESLRQYAITKPHLGTYWDNINRGWRYCDKVAVTARILQAFNEVDPRESEINDIRKWMLLMKQTNDWGSSSLAADAVFTLLTTGSPWLERAPQRPAISIAGVPVTFDKVDEWLGYTRKTIDAAKAGAVTIDRTASGPAWGAIYAQWVAPMTEVQAAGIEDLTITKRLALYQADGSLKAVDGTTLHVGDKVQVRLTIKNQRDLDYVTVIDERGACFEPVDQTSGYRYADRIGYYHETKDSSTRLFFSDLYKGTHVISYDLYVMAPGQFSVGIATIQSQYAPQETAHTAGMTVTVE